MPQSSTDSTSDSLFDPGAKCALLEKHNEHLTRKLKESEEQVRYLQKMLYGKKSEKITVEQGLIKGTLDAVQAQSPTPADSASDSTEEKKDSSSTKPRKKYHGTDLSGLEVRCVEIIPQEVKDNPEKYERLPDSCAEVTDRVEKHSAELFVRREIRPKFVLKERGKRAKDAPICAPASKNVIPGSYVGASFLALIAYNKYAMHLPCERQLTELARMGLPLLSNQHLCGWLESGSKVIRPLYNQLHENLLKQDALHVDETPVRCLKQEQIHGYMWVMTGSQNGLSYYHWGKSRSSQELDHLLRKDKIPTSAPYQGIIITDNYAGYDAWVERIRPESQRPVQAGCWAHARRKFKDAELSCEDSAFCREIVESIAPLYGVEKAIRENELSLEEVRTQRQEIKPQVEAIFERLKSYLKKKAPLGKLKTAINYTLKLEEKLQVYLEHPEVGIDNNPVERAIRKVAIGRKNWSFIGHPNAGEKAAIYYTMITECKRVGIDPLAWLTHVFRELPKHKGEKSLHLSLMPEACAKRQKSEN